MTPQTYTSNRVRLYRSLTTQIYWFSIIHIDLVFVAFNLPSICKRRKSGQVIKKSFVPISINLQGRRIYLRVTTLIHSISCLNPGLSSSIHITVAPSSPNFSFLSKDARKLVLHITLMLVPTIHQLSLIKFQISFSFPMHFVIRTYYIFRIFKSQHLFLNFFYKS